MPTFWITKYALSKGVYSVECDDPEQDTPGLIYERTDTYPQFYHGEGKDWHRSEDAARAKAEMMRKKKIASLRKQIEKYEILIF